MEPGVQLAALLVFLFTHPLFAQIKLTGVTAFDSQANRAFRGLHGWNTINDFYWNLYVFTGSVASPTFSP